MASCDEFISPEQLEEIRINWGIGLSQEDWNRIQSIRDKLFHTDFKKIAYFKLRSQDLNWTIY